MLDIYEISQRLILHEGLRLQPYRCIKGRLTIGVGRNLDSNPLSSEEKSVLVIGNTVSPLKRQCIYCVTIY